MGSVTVDCSKDYTIPLASGSLARINQTNPSNV